MDLFMRVRFPSLTLMNFTFLEIFIPILFGCSWPVSIYKSVKSRTTKGKSIIFLFINIAGYVIWITYKYFTNFNFVLYLYVINVLMVICDVVIYFINLHREKQLS